MGDISQSLFQKAKACIPGGVNSPVRAGKAVGIDPPFISRAKGCLLWDEDGNEYIDYVCSWGPMILGHANFEVFQALEKAYPRERFPLIKQIEVLGLMDLKPEMVAARERLERLDRLGPPKRK